MMKWSTALLAGLALSAAAHAEVTTKWDFDSVTAPSANTTTFANIAASTGTGFASIVHAANSTYSTPAGNGSAKSVSSTNWKVGDYYQFSFSTVGYRDLIVTFDQTSSGTGPKDFKLSYSTDGVSFVDFASYALANVSWSAGTYRPASTVSMDLSGKSELDNLASVFIRLTNSSTASLNGGTVASGGTSRLDNFTVNVSPVPEPGTTAMLLAGLAAVGFVARRRRQHGA